MCVGFERPRDDGGSFGHATLGADSDDDDSGTTFDGFFSSYDGPQCHDEEGGSSGSSDATAATGC
jgi:hypothetical protein